jgi:hypothetical protein
MEPKRIEASRSERDSRFALDHRRLARDRQIFSLAESAM